MQDIQEKYSTAVSERDNLEKSLQSMGDLSARQAESERITRSAEKQLNATTLEKNKLKDQVEALTAQVMMIITLCDGVYVRREDSGSSVLP